METRQQTAVILREAAKVMIKGGYVEGIRYGEDNGHPKGSHCALGAIEVAAGIGRYSATDYTPAVQELAKMLVANGATPSKHLANIIANWNNFYCNSAEQVACVMNATAKHLEESEE